MSYTLRKLIEKEISYLEDNKFRYELENKSGEHNEIIRKHENNLKELREILKTV